MQQMDHTDGLCPVGYLMSACWMMRPTLFDEVGLLDENIFYAPEDVEFCIRVWKKNRYFIVHRHRFCTIGRDCPTKSS